MDPIIYYPPSFGSSPNYEIFQLPGPLDRSWAEAEKYGIPIVPLMASFPGQFSSRDRNEIVWAGLARYSYTQNREMEKYKNLL